ncbi:MAG: PAS domain S-box protein [Desulfovibrionaceae bacterium]
MLRRRVRELEAALALSPASCPAGADETWRSVFDSALVGIYRTTPQGRFLNANPALAKMLGYASVEELLHDITDIAAQIYVDPADRKHHITEALASGGICSMELAWKTRDGETIWVQSDLRAVRDAQNEIAHLEGLVMDITERRLSQERLKASEERFRTMAEFTLDWEYWLGNEHAFRYISPSCEQITGYTSEEFQDNPNLLDHIVHPDDRAAWYAHLAGEQGHSPSSHAFDFRIRTKSGQERWIGHNCHPVYGPEGEPLGRRVSNRDITERKGIELQLQMLKRVVEQSPVSIVITDTKGDITYVNPHFQKLTGYSATEVQGQNPRILKSGNLSESFYRTLWETILAGREWRGEFCNKKKNGDIYWENATISPMTNEAGAITHFIAVKEDITERRKAEILLRESDARYREVVEGTDNLVFRLDPEGKVLLANTATRRLLDQDDLIGRDSFEMIHPDDRDRVRHNFFQAMQLQQPTLSAESRLLTPKGARHIQWSIQFVRDNHGRFLAANGIGLDVTESRKLEQLRDDVERITRHDLKSPLLGIVSVPQLLLAANNLDPDQRELIQAIEDSGYRMLQLINLSLDLYKMETGTYELQARPLDLSQVLRRVMEEAQRPFLHRKVVLTRAPEQTGGSYLVLGEELLCHSLFSNLIKNALEATPDNGQTEVRLLQGDPARIEVRNPKPVPSNMRDCFFDKYATSGKNQGTGLGTYSAKLMTEIQNGAISMRTSREEGTVITVSLPRPA